VEEIEELRARVAELEEKLSEKATAEISYELDVVHLDESEQRVLRLLAAGLRQNDALKVAGVPSTFITNHFRESLYFARELQSVQSQYQHWQEAQIKFIMPRVWEEVIKILHQSPED
jgi:hypothetical protein